MTSILLPFPPTANTYYRHVGSKVLISEKGREYRLRVRYTWLQAGFRGSQKGEKLSVWVKCHPPDKRVRDLGNLDKSLMDALTHAGAWHDDFDIDDQRFTRVWEGQPPGSVLVIIRPIADPATLLQGPCDPPVQPSSFG